MTRKTSITIGGGCDSATPTARRHERPDARRADEGGEQSGEESAGCSALVCKIAADAHQRSAHLEDAEQVEANREHHEREERDHRRILQLEAEAGLLARRLERDEDGADGGEADEDAAEIGEAVRARLPSDRVRCARGRRP